MKPHAPRSRRKIRTAALVSALLAACGLVLASATPADATLSTKDAKFSNADVAAQCQFAVNAVDPATYAAHTTIQAVAQPKTLAGSYNNKFTQVFCYLYDPTGTLLASFAPSTAGAYLSAGQNFVVPYENYYILCGYAFVKLRNGNSSFTPFVCV